ncbi:hypothetical protein [Cupriavidus sp. BIC8F]|uniref:hypothetical protein n=1 Tax=Cupriavidus sp. BIC8F TaxID=3079014 RepID=UPI002916456B|nr:hypothetical protein [Cupriavidus sp. BIC8F]
MSGVLVIGLLKSMRQRFNADCARMGVDARIVLADMGNKGHSYMLIPYPGEAVNALRDYADSLDDFRDAHVIVMPYAEMPDELDGELGVLVDSGATVVRAVSGEDGWPPIQKKTKADPALLEQMRQRLWREIPVVQVDADEPTLPSEYFRQVCDANPQVIIVEQVYETCDLVEPIRREFLNRAIEALAEFARDGSDGRIDAFFRQRRLMHAQNGPNESTLELRFGEVLVLNETVQAHLKQGDATTPQGAARLFYHHTIVGGIRYVIVTYAGPHPEGNFKRVSTRTNSIP